MEVFFGYQYFDSDPEEVQKQQGFISLEKALDLFTNFPWEEQFKAVLKREEEDLTSTSPALYFYKTDKRFLSISADNDEGFYISYVNENRFGELFVTNNILERPEGISVEQFIEDFYSNSVEEVLELDELEEEPLETIKITLEYNQTKLYQPTLYMLAPFLFLLFENHNPGIIIPLIFSMSFVIFLIILPRLLLNFSYWKNDHQQEIIYDPVQKLIKLTRNNQTKQFKRADIKSIDLVRARTFQNAFNEFTYVRIRATDEVFAVTHFSVDSYDLLSMINMNYRDIAVFYPSLKL